MCVRVYSKRSSLHPWKYFGNKKQTSNNQESQKHQRRQNVINVINIWVVKYIHEYMIEYIDDQHKNPNMNNIDNQVRQLTTTHPVSPGGVNLPFPYQRWKFLFWITRSFLKTEKRNLRFLFSNQNWRFCLLQISISPLDWTFWTIVNNWLVVFWAGASLRLDSLFLIGIYLHKFLQTRTLPWHALIWNHEMKLQMT